MLAALALGALPQDWTLAAPEKAWFGWQDLRTGLQVFPTHPVEPKACPGSIMKLVTTSVLLEENLLNPDTVFECRGTYPKDGINYHCQHAHGKLGLKDALGLSCNVYFVKASQKLSVQRLLHYAQLYGLSTPAKPASSLTAMYALGLQADMQIPARQLLHLVDMIANRKIAGFHPVTWELLHGGMRLCVTKGTGLKLDPDNRFHIAAKTGTIPYGKTYQSWVVGYFPLEAPRYAFCMRSPIGTAKDSAVPMARQALLSRTWA